MKGYEEMGNIKFGYEGLDMPILFTPKGLIHLHRKYERISHSEEEKLEKQGIPEEEIERRLIITDYHTYGTLQDKAYGYKKVIYKNIYPGIDLVYSFTNKGQLGFEYSLLVKPGADLSVVKLKYGGDIKKIKTDRQGSLFIRSDVDGISSTAPVSYYGEILLNDAVANMKVMTKPRQSSSTLL